MKLDSDQYSGELPYRDDWKSEIYSKVALFKGHMYCKGTVDCWLIPSGFLDYLSISGEYMQAQSNKYSSF